MIWLENLRLNLMIVWWLALTCTIRFNFNAKIKFSHYYKPHNQSDFILQSYYSKISDRPHGDMCKYLGDKIVSLGFL